MVVENGESIDQGSKGEVTAHQPNLPTHCITERGATSCQKLKTAMDNWGTISRESPGR